MRRLFAGAAILLLVGACSSDEASSGTTVATAQPSTESSPRLDEALAVAAAFTEARSERDIDKLTAHSVDGFISGFVVLSTAAMPAEFVWQDAVGWSTEFLGCEITEPSVTTPTVRCDVTHHNAISEALGVGPYPGKYHLKVRFEGDQWLGKTLARTAVTESHQTEFPILDFTVETWRPFVKWLKETHPEDVDQMLGPTVQADVEFLIVAGERNPLLGDDSTALWGERTMEFVAMRTSS